MLVRNIRVPGAVLSNRIDPAPEGGESGDEEREGGSQLGVFKMTCCWWAYVFMYAIDLNDLGTDLLSIIPARSQRCRVETHLILGRTVEVKVQPVYPLRQAPSHPRHLQ